MKKIKVLEIGPGDFGKSGLSNIVWNWYQKFNHEKITVDFLSHIMPEDKYIKNIKEHGGDFFCAGDKNSIIQSFKKLFVTRKVAKINKYDCIHIHASSAYGAFLHYIAVTPFCNNIIIHSHNSGIDLNSSKLYLDLISKIKYLLHRIFRNFIAGKKITRLSCSKLAAEWMYPKKYIINNNYTIIKNGIEIENFAFNQCIREKIRSEFNFQNKFVVGHIGRFAYQKNHKFLINVFNEVHKRNSNAVLFLIGEGELKIEIKKMVNNLKINDSVIFYGTTPNVKEFYQAMDCFILPSHFEGMPVVAVEAQASGCKILCSDTITKEAQITNLLEYMSLSESIEKWTDKILSYNNNYERKDMSTEIRNVGYDIEQSAKQLERLYSEAVSL